MSSTFSSPFFTATASQPSPPPSGGDLGRGSSSSSLYLFTFLATLFLLLIISCAIVLRSFVLRRRFRRRIEEALAAGVLLPPGPGGARRRDFGEKPKFYDVWVKPGEEGWDNIMPVSGNSLPSGQPSVDKELLGSTHLSDEDNDSSTPPTAPSRVGQFLRSPFTQQRNSPSPLHSPSSPALGSELVGGERKLQVSVLVAMPTPHKMESENSDSQAVPDVVFGVMQVPYRYYEDEQHQQQDS